jgi:HAD superfamily hydrolase (TIGR01509 family)
MIKAVIFDVDGVLIDSFDANLKFYQDLLVHAGYAPLTGKEFIPMFHLPMRGVLKTCIKSDDENEVDKIVLLWKNRVISYPYDLLKSPAGMGSVITGLRKTYILAIVTSRLKGGVFNIPQLVPLEKHIQTTVYFEDTVEHKPDPEPLLLAASKLNIKSAECVYIGDTASDVQAAKSAGMNVILYAQNVLPQADATTFSFAEIPPIIRRLSTKT